MGTSPGAEWCTPFQRHQARRDQGVPTVTVLVGDPDAAQWIWERWLHATGRLGVASSADGMLEAWLGSEAVRRDVEQAVLRRMAERAGTTLDELRSRIASKTPLEIEDQVLLASSESGCPPGVLWNALGLPGNAGESWASAMRRLPYSALPALAELLAGRLPALLFRSAPDGSDDASAAAARQLLEIAEFLPRAELGIALSVGERQSFGTRASDRERTLLRAGEVWLRPSPSQQTRTTNHHELTIDYDPGAVARSRAERELFRQLEARPRTRGLFTLNKTLGEAFGGAPVEIDLFSERLRVAIEIDGYHHFRDAIAYRRDRRKDLLLQELECLVVRVLASDVADELDYVLETIDRAVERRMEKTR